MRQMLALIGLCHPPRFYQATVGECARKHNASSYLAQEAKTSKLYGDCYLFLRGINSPSPSTLIGMNCLQDKLDEIDTCNVCLENGKLRNCCNRHYCRLCYEGTGNCPGCDLITIGANRGLLKQVQSGTKVPGDGAATNTTEHVQECEECRLCLRQGFTRKCCGEFFCSDCYFKTGHCPSCRSLVQTWIKSERIPRDPGNLPVLLGYLATLLVSLAVLACAAIAVANNYSFIATVFGQTCYGFFPSCSKDTKCVEFEGSASSGLEPTTAWTNCKNESTVNKVYGTYCVFDKTVRRLEVEASINICTHITRRKVCCEPLPRAVDGQCSC